MCVFLFGTFGCCILFRGHVVHFVCLSFIGFIQVHGFQCPMLSCVRVGPVGWKWVTGVCEKNARHKETQDIVSPPRPLQFNVGVVAASLLVT